MNKVKGFLFETKTDIRRLLLKVFLPLIRCTSRRLTFVYDSDSVYDGVGAQVQRIIAIAGLAGYLSSNYQHAPIKNLTTHPMDPFQDFNEKIRFLQKLNSCIRPTTFCAEQNRNSLQVQISVLGIFQIFKLGAQSIIQNKRITVCTVEVYPIVDSKPSIYGLYRKFLEIDFREDDREIQKVDVAVHYRRGVVGMAIYHNQASPRELPLEYYLKCLTSLKISEGISSATILTDSPLVDSVYKIGDDQIPLWENTPGYESGALHIKGQNLIGDFQSLNFQIDVKTGGDPIESLAILQTARVLVMSRSSFSFVAALLNKNGKIIYPPGFWHPRLRHWLSIS